ncbi:uroporphyrinogen III methyltransferase/synthase [Thermosporothrix hazakensis]|jgi:uroporphyrinogen-III synthase|uniref:Uroporphyrinogen III methyltransferase/synthase n=1 Tax=Thermosporothrix hazakensis TaxID=644383 RepID=A0A326U8B6_THEHA|nr:uroporphyrinogen-III synthase [Thermosporothrix hazakensis]PZW30649.1 uroporphyrinogen III methyltransferase/synthase [Thermosporothrix hazakensis]GCE49512.1 hypothetical protein KTH_43810 [Thermosporothrix hazakensis]
MAEIEGKRILVTRTREQASVLCEQLRSLGAFPIELPTITIVPPDDWSELDTALLGLYERYDWVIFTSANGVKICMERLRSRGYDPTRIKARVATIGPATAAALQTYGVTANLVPSTFIAEGVAAALREDAQRKGHSLAGQRILLARAAEAREVLITELREAGAIVDVVAAYFTVPVTGNAAESQAVFQMLQTRQLDLLTFTSSSTVRNFVHWLNTCTAQGLQQPDLSQVAIACIGPITAQTARELGLHVTIEAQEFTIPGLVEAILHYYEDAKNDRADNPIK